MLKDPRLSTTLAEFRRQFDRLTRSRDKITEIHDAIRVIRSVTEQVQELGMPAVIVPGQRGVVSTPSGR